PPPPTSASWRRAGCGCNRMSRSCRTGWSARGQGAAVPWCFPPRRGCLLLAQQPACLSEVLQLGVRLLQGNLVVLARSESAVGIEADPLRGHMRQRLLHALGDLL